MRYYLAIDIGASGGRHIIGYLSEGKIKTREIYRFENGMIEKNGHLCWDEKALFHHVLTGMKACHEQGFTPVSLAIDTWGVDFALLDRDGNTVGDVVAYRDSRTQGMDQLLEETLPFEVLYRQTGIAKQPFNTLYQMMAVLREHPSYRTQVADFLMMPEYLSYRLTGKRMHEQTILSTSALLDAFSGSWAQTVIDKANLPQAWFQTPIASPGTVLGALSPAVAESIGFDAQVVLPASHDTASAYMAVPAMDANAAFLSSGTWSLLGTELNRSITDAQSLCAGFTNECGWMGSVRYLKNIMGMWVIQSIRRELDTPYTYAEMAEMAAASTYSYYIDASDNRFLSPKSMLEAVREALDEQGAPPPQGVGDILRAVTLGLAVCYRDSIQAMGHGCQKHFTSVNIVGGGCQNITLNQLTADLTGLPVYAGPTEGTSLGNLAAQMIADGSLKDLSHFRSLLTESFEIVPYAPRA